MMTQEIMQALKAIEDKIMREPVAFNWTPEMCAIWPAEYRPTMSGLLAIWAAMHEAAVYGEAEASTSPKPLADDGWIEWGGGKLPEAYRRGQRVETKHRGGDVYTENLAWDWEMWPDNFWTHENLHTDIIAYRVVSL